MKLTPQEHRDLARKIANEHRELARNILATADRIERREGLEPPIEGMIGIDLRPEELARLEAFASRQGIPSSILAGKIVRGAIALHERLGMRVSIGPDSVDIRPREERV